MPTRWDVVPIEEHSFDGISSGYKEDYREFLPTVDSELLAEVRLKPIQSFLPPTEFIQARERIAKAEEIIRMGAGAGSQSL